MSWKTTAQIAAGLLFFLNLVVPPFQNPDEPFHFAAAVLYARGESGETARDPQSNIEAGILRMMDQSHWWRLVGIGRPQPLPKRISDVEYLMDKTGSDDFRVRISHFVLWHRLAGMAMKPVANWRVEGLYYLGRAASSGFLIAAFFLLWKTFILLGRVFGEGVRLGFYLIFSLPQLWLMGTSVSPDPFLVFLFALFFYVAAVLMEKGAAADFKWNRAAAGRMALVVILPIIGVLSDRSAFVLAPLALLLVVMILFRTNPKTAVPILLIGAIGVILAVYFAAVRFPLQMERVFTTVSGMVDKIGPFFFKIFDLTGFAGRFWVFVTDTFLLKFGWLVFGVPHAVYWAWRIMVLAAGIGLVARIVWWAKARMRDEGEAGAGETKKAEGAGVGVKAVRKQWLLLAFTAVVLQAAGMWAFYGGNFILAQGRYFFPVIAPAAFFLALGFLAFGDMIRKGLGQKVLAGVIMAEFLILAIGLWSHILPAFHLILRGPHPGV